MPIKFIILMLLTAATGLAQQPGGVAGFVHWSRPNGKGAGDLNINHHVVHKNKADSIRPIASLSLGGLSGVTFICVSQSDPANEQALWSFQSDSANNVMMTNRRMANLGQRKFINFSPLTSQSPRLVTYFQSLEGKDTLAPELLFYDGEKTELGVPVKKLSGVVPETIIFNRVLSWRERLQVESYLALKYGLSLSQTFPTPYLDSRGTIIWDAGKYGSYAGAIAGLGRDDLSDLNQSISGSMETPGLLELKCLHLEDKDYLVWGDNRAPLIFSRKRAETKKLQRQWLVSVTGDFSSKTTSLMFDATQIREMHPLDDQEIYWLAIDHGGTGAFPVAKTSYYANLSGNNTNLLFEGIGWDPDHSKHDLFTIVAAPALFAALQLSLPSCHNLQTGSVDLDIVGGTPPFEIKIFDKDGSLMGKQSGEQRNGSFSGLKQGTYRLAIIDQSKQTFSQEFFVHNSDMGQLPLFEPQWMVEGATLDVDASALLASPSDYQYEWESPQGEKIYRPCIAVDHPGIYRLTVTNKDGCSTQRELEFRSQPSDYFSSVELFPNPTSSGKVNLRVQLKNKGSIKVTVSNAAGNMLSSDVLGGDNYYAFSCQLPHVGVWFVTLEGNGERKSYKVLSNNPIK